MGLFFRRTRRQLALDRAQLDQERRELAREAVDQRAHLDRLRAQLEAERAEVEADAERFQTLLRSRTEAHELIAKTWAEWELARTAEVVKYVRHKKHPAKTAAQVVKEKGKEMAELRRRMKLAEYVAQMYEFHFPWLIDLRDLDGELDYATTPEVTADADDPVAKLLSAEEWAQLSTCERNQRALDRYLRGRQSPWQLGRDYERYVGYLREQDGYSVTYHGIVHGFEDLGRDILAMKDGEIEVIQCKRWAQHKTIHEKHVFQLFGTMVAARIENPTKTVRGTFTTTTSLSDRAREFASVLDIRVEENRPLADYPRIKCNIARRTGEKIYHLPFDQQYDTTRIEPTRGELYAATCAEAEWLGFRRAWRWLGKT